MDLRFEKLGRIALVLFMLNGWTIRRVAVKETFHHLLP